MAVATGICQASSEAHGGAKNSFGGGVITGVFLEEVGPFQGVSSLRLLLPAYGRLLGKKQY